MSEFTNGLTPAQAERLALLAEECGEVVQVVAKILRHGYESFSPYDPAQVTNRRLLETEIGHVEHAIFRMHEAEDLDPLAVLDSVDEKAKKIGRYLHHQADAAPGGGA